MTGEFGRIAAAGNIWNLRRRESDHVEVGIVAKDNVEIMKVAPSSTQDKNVFHEQGSSNCASAYSRPTRPKGL